MTAATMDHDPSGTPETARPASEATGRPRLGILQCGHAPPELLGRFADYPDMFRELLGRERFDYRVFAVVDEELPDGAHAAEAWLITGSRHGVYEDHPWITPLERLVREIRDAALPLVGICFGHQIIAQALGGRVEKFTGGWSAGRVDYRLDRRFGAEDGTDLPLMAFHQDQVIEPPPDAETIGSSDFCRHAAMVIGPRILTLQPHPEFDGDFVSGLLEARERLLPPERLALARASLAGAEAVEHARARVGRALAEFLDAGAAERGGREDPAAVGER